MLQTRKSVKSLIPVEKLPRYDGSNLHSCQRSPVDTRAPNSFGRAHHPSFFCLVRVLKVTFCLPCDLRFKTHHWRIAAVIQDPPETPWA